MEGCLASLIALISIPFAYVVNGWALATLWGWFIVPTFDVPTLSIPVAIGLAIVVGYLTKATPNLDSVKESKSSREAAVDILAAMFYSFLHPLVALGVGWIVLQFI